VGLVLLPAAIPTEVSEVAEKLHRTIPNPFRAAAVKRRAAKSPRTVHRSSHTSTSSKSSMARHQPTGGLRQQQQQTFRSKTTPLLNAVLPSSTSRLRTSNRHSCRPTVHLQSETFNSQVTNQQVRDSDAVVDDPSALTIITCINYLCLAS